MQHFTEDDFSDEEFPESSRMIHRFKHTKKGEGRMCKIVEDYAAEKAAERDKYFSEALMLFDEGIYDIKEYRKKNIPDEVSKIVLRSTRKSHKDS